MTYAAISRSAHQGSPGPEGSIIKLYYSELAQRIYHLAFEILGDDGLHFVSRWAPDGWSGHYLYSYSLSIAGGTSEVQRNIIGERVLGAAALTGWTTKRRAWTFSTPEQQEISSVAAALLAKTMDDDQGDARRRTSAIGHGQWARFGALGWFGLSVPGGRGGVGYGMAEEALLFREIGRHLAPGPFLACTLAARVALAGGAEELAAAILAGEITVGLAQPRGAQFDVGDVVSGSFDLLDAVDGSHVVVVTRHGAAVMAAEAWGRAEQLSCMDPAISLGRIGVDQAPAIVHTSVPPTISSSGGPCSRQPCSPASARRRVTWRPNFGKTRVLASPSASIRPSSTAAPTWPCEPRPPPRK